MNTTAGPWRTVAGVFTVLAVVTGLSFYSMSAYLDSLTAKGFPVSVASLGPTLTSLASGVGGVWVARLMPRLPSRLLIVGGAVVAGVALVGVGWARTPLELCLAFVVFGVACAFTSVVPCSDLVARWFAPTPERAMTIASSGMSVGGAITPPIVFTVLTHFELAAGSVIIGIGLVVLVAVAATTIAEPPRSSAAVDLGRTANGPRRGWPGAPFATLFAAFVLLAFSQVGTVTHIVRIAREREIGGAAVVLSVIAVSSLAARLVGAIAIPRIGLRTFAVLITSTQTVAQLILAMAGGLPALLGGAALLGTTMGNTFVMMSLFVLAAFRIDEFPRTYAWLSIGATVGAAAGPILLGLADGWFGGYRVPLVLMGIASAAGATLLFVTRVGARPAGAGRPAEA